MEFKYKKTLLSLAIIGSLGLTGCSSSSSSSDDPADDPAVPQATTTSGAAAKGILNKGAVSAVELNDLAENVGELGTATTIEDGSYSLDLADTYAGGPIQLTITATADTEMKCDVPVGCGTRADDIVDTDTNVDFGEWYKPGENSIHMQALVPSATDGASVDVSISHLLQT